MMMTGVSYCTQKFSVISIQFFLYSSSRRHRNHRVFYFMFMVLNYNICFSLSHSTCASGAIELLKNIYEDMETLRKREDLSLINIIAWPHRDITR